MSSGYLIDPSHLERWASMPADRDVETRSTLLLAATIVMCVTGVVAVSWRIRTCVVFRTWKPSDKLAIVSLFFALAYFVVFSCGIYNWRLGGHSFDLATDELVSSIKAYFILQIVYLATSAVMKMSLMCYLKSIMKIQASSIQRGLNLAAVAIFLQMLVFMGVITFSCEPYNAYWMQVSPAWTSEHEFHCWNGNATLTAAIATQVGIDFVACLSILGLIHSSAIVSRRPRLYSVNVIFGSGVILVGGYRIWFITRELHRTNDFVWYGCDLTFWGCIEVACFLLLCSWPAIRDMYNYNQSSGGEELSWNVSNSQTADPWSRLEKGLPCNGDPLPRISVTTTMATATADLPHSNGQMRTHVLDTFGWRNMRRDEVSCDGHILAATEITVEYEPRQG